MRSLSVFIVSVCMICNAVAAELPPAVETKFTDHDLRKVTLAYYRRQFVEAYDKVGLHDPKWDAAAKAVLEKAVIGFADTGFSEMYKPGIDTSNVTMQALIDAAAEQGCLDPMFLYVEAIVADDRDDAAAYERVLQKAMPAILESKYPINQKLWVLQRYIQAKSRQLEADKVSALVAQRQQLLVNFLSEPVADPLERRVKFALVINDFDSMSTPEQTIIIKGIDAAPACDSWIKHLFHGYHEIRLAWNARGNGWADTVTEEGWKNLAIHLAKAEAELTAAYIAQPTYPEAAAAMIQVAMGQNKTATAGRQWFDRAKAAQLDFTPAWNAYAYALLPRWGGSHQQVYELGCEAMRTQRYDTNVPEFLIQALAKIGQDMRGTGKTDYSFYKTPTVWTNLKRVFDGYLAKPFPEMNVNRWRTNKAVLAFQCGEYGEALSQFDELKDKVVPELVAGYDTTLEAIVAESRAMLSDVGNDLKIARSSENEADFVSAVSGYTKVLGRIKADHPAWNFAQMHLQLDQAYDQLARGKKADIPLKREADLIVWSGDKTGWTIVPDGLVYTANKKTKTNLAYLLNMSPNTRIRVEWNYSSPHPPRGPVFSVEFQRIPDVKGKVLRVCEYPAVGAVRVESEVWMIHGAQANIKIAPDQWHTWVIEHKGNTLSVQQDGVAILKDLNDPWIGAGTPILNLSVSTPIGGGTMKIRNLSLEPMPKDVPAP